MIATVPVTATLPAVNGNTTERLHVLVVEDTQQTARLVESWLYSSGMAEEAGVQRADSLAAALEILACHSPDIIILDLNLADSSGLDAFRAVKNSAPGVPIIIMSGEMDEEIAVTAVREGAQDYIVKANHHRNPLVHPVRLALERIKRQQVEALLRNAGEQLAIAQSVQEHLYPDIAPVLPGFDMAGHCIPGEGIAGDYFDYLPLPHGMGIVVGDVMGHGYDAALVMAGVRGVLRALAHTYTDLGDLLSRANQVLAPDLAERFVTVLFAAIDPVASALHYAAAGHAGFLLDREGNVKERLQATAPPLGVGDGTVLTSSVVSLSEGDILLLYTDGISESCSPSGAVFGDAGVLQIIRDSRHQSAREIVDILLRTAHDFSEHSPQLDDMTVVVVKFETAANRS